MLKSTMTFKVKDYYFNKAKQENYLARSIYKLEEIDQKYKVLKQGDKVIDCGYYPGSWIQYTSSKIGANGKVVGLDIQEINPKLQNLANVKLFHMDINDVGELSDVGLEGRVDVFLSDMAPSTTGIKDVDQIRSAQLVEMVFGLLPKFLKDGGHLVVKVFESADVQKFLKEQKNNFKTFNYLRPKSTRSVSKEFFVIGKEYHNK